MSASLFAELERIGALLGASDAPADHVSSMLVRAAVLVHARQEVGPLEGLAVVAEALRALVDVIAEDDLV